MLRRKFVRVLGIVSALGLIAIAPRSALAQGGTITGTVTSAETLQPLGAVQVYIDGTQRGTITRADGAFMIPNVPAGTHTLVAQSLGYQQGRQTGVVVTAGGTTTVTIQLAQSVLALQGVVVTGLVDPVEGSRSPITVAQVTTEQMPVPATSDPMTQLQGKVAGVSIVRTTGQPGQQAAVRLRTPTSALGSNRPLYVVDGVILGTDAVDIESSDIQSIEVIKGAAAASLYGSRAASGVIAITTNRGRGLSAGTTQFKFDSEYGVSEAANFAPMPKSHQFEVNAQGQLVNAQGQPVNWGGRYENPRAAFMDKPFPSEFGVYDNLSAIYRPGTFNSQNFSLTSNSENTNLAASVNRMHELGALEGNDGYQRTAFRVNLDHRFRETLQLGVSGYHSRAFRDDLGKDIPGGNGLVIGDFFLIPPFVDLTQKNDKGEYDRYVTAQGVQVEHPIWRQYNRDEQVRRARTLGNATLRWTPTGWFNANADVSFDREDAQQMVWTPKGAQDSDEPFDGRLAYNDDITDTFNGSLQFGLRKDIGQLNTRTTVRGIIERVDVLENDAEGRDFRVFDVRDIDAAAIKRAGSSSRDIRSTGYLVDQAFDYAGKYIFSALGRRDGSSLFGPDNRWHNYYRVAGAWRVAEEEWFNVAGISELKLKASRGTAGGRPQFEYQYETWQLTDQGPTKGTLGNRDLRPEHTTENEVGVELILFDKIGVELVHARQKTEHQLVNVNLPASVGYTSQWINAGTLEGSSTELAVEARLIDRDDFTWTTNFVGDRTSSEVTEWPVPCRVVNTISYICAGANPRDIYGFSYLKSTDGLPEYLQPFKSQFQVNDEGWLVWVGEGNTFRDGKAKNLWGTTGTIAGERFGWGFPVVQKDNSRNMVFGKIGNGDPAFQLGWMNTVTFGGFTAHAAMHASVGGEVWNMTRHYMIFDGIHGDLDQSGKAEELKKPIQYYRNGIYNGSLKSNAFVEDASYLKLRTVSLTYDFSDDVLERTGLDGLGIGGLKLGLTGRNIFTIDNYSGFDPEIVSGERMVPLDYYQYPALRNYTVTVGVTF